MGFTKNGFFKVRRFHDRADLETQFGVGSTDGSSNVPAGPRASSRRIGSRRNGCGQRPLPCGQRPTPEEEAHGVHHEHADRGLGEGAARPRSCGGHSRPVAGAREGTPFKGPSYRTRHLHPEGVAKVSGKASPEFREHTTSVHPVRSSINPPNEKPHPDPGRRNRFNRDQHGL